MSLEGYNRFIARSADLICWGIVTLGALMWLATVADHLFQLGWGWDPKIVWMAPITMAGALITRKSSRVIFRLTGARD